MSMLEVCDENLCDLTGMGKVRQGEKSVGRLRTPIWVYLVVRVGIPKEGRRI